MDKETFEASGSQDSSASKNEKTLNVDRLNVEMRVEFSIGKK